MAKKDSICNLCTALAKTRKVALSAGGIGGAGVAPVSNDSTRAPKFYLPALKVTGVVLFGFNIYGDLFTIS